MSEQFVDRDAVVVYLIEWLIENSKKQIGDHDIPSNYQFPYAVLYLIGTQNEGPWAKPDDDMEIVIQITCVGQNPRQTRWMSDTLRGLLIGRDTDGQYLLPMHPEGFAVVARWASGLGAIVKSGDRLYESPDTYRLKVVPSQ